MRMYRDFLTEMIRLDVRSQYGRRVKKHAERYNNDFNIWIGSFHTHLSLYGGMEEGFGRPNPKFSTLPVKISSDIADRVWWLDWRLMYVASKEGLDLKTGDWIRAC